LNDAYRSSAVHLRRHLRLRAADVADGCHGDGDGDAGVVYAAFSKLFRVLEHEIMTVMAVMMVV